MSKPKKNLEGVFFGAEALGGTDWGDINIPELKMVVAEAVDYGIRSFDVADCYGLGLAEINLADALSHDRHDVVIATKGGVRWSKSIGRAKTRIDLNPKYIKKAFFASLKRLRLDKIPIYFLHYPTNDENFIRSLELLDNLRQDKLIERVGLSNINSKQLEIALDVCNIDIVQLPCNILNLPLDTDIEELCKEKEIEIVAYNVLACGLLTGKFNSQSCFPESDRRSRHVDFIGDRFINNLQQIEQLKRKAADTDQTLFSYSIQELFFRYTGILSAIIGIKSQKQLLDLIRIKDSFCKL